MTFRHFSIEGREREAVSELFPAVIVRLFKVGQCSTGVEIDSRLRPHEESAQMVDRMIGADWIDAAVEEGRLWKQIEDGFENELTSTIVFLLLKRSQKPVISARLHSRPLWRSLTRIVRRGLG
jgi:hypothetical protein